MDMSQRRLEPEQGTEITDKVDEQRRTSTFGQDCCRRDILEKDTPGTGGGGVGWSSEISVVVFVDKGCCGTGFLDRTGHQLQHSLVQGDGGFHC